MTRAHPEPDILNTICKIMPVPEEPISILYYHPRLHLQSDRFVWFCQLKGFMHSFISYLLFDTLSPDRLAQFDSRHDI
jgi:hypothetical protein